MKAKWIVSGLILLGLLLAISGCQEAGLDYILFINEDGCHAKGLDGKPIETLWVFPGDKIVWINTASVPMTIEFKNSSIFGIKEVQIPSGNRSTTTVRKHKPGSFEYVITPCAAKTGPSKINILDGTPSGKVSPPP